MPKRLTPEWMTRDSIAMLVGAVASCPIAAEGSRDAIASRSVATIEGRGSVPRGFVVKIIDGLCVQVQHRINFAIPVEMFFDAFASGGTELRAQGWIGGQGVHGAGETVEDGLRIGGIDEDSAAGVDVVGGSSP